MTRFKSKALPLLLAVIMLLTLMPFSALAAEPEPEFSDISGHWAEDAIGIWADRGVLKGENGLFRPNDSISRAELAAVLCRVMGYTETSTETFPDVPSGIWYEDYVRKLYAADIMQGDGSGALRPLASITRQEAAVLMGRAFDLAYVVPPTWLPGGGLDSDAFPDHDDIAEWAGSLVYSMKFSGYVSGDTEGKFNPTASISRAEVVTILNNMVELYFDKAGDYDCDLIGEIDGGVLVNAAGVTLRNLTTNGEFWITAGVGGGDVTLDNVTINGDTHIFGGGPNGISVKGGSFGVILLGSKTHPRLELSKETVVGRIYLQDTGSVARDGVTIGYSAATDTLSIGGAVDELELDGNGTATVTVGDLIYYVLPAEDISKLALAADAVVSELTLNGKATVSGSGRVEKAAVNADGVVIEASVSIKTENITVAEGVGIKVGDKDYTGTGEALPKEL